MYVSSAVHHAVLALHMHTIPYCTLYSVHVDCTLRSLYCTDFGSYSMCEAAQKPWLISYILLFLATTLLYV